MKIKPWFVLAVLFLCAAPAGLAHQESPVALSKIVDAGNTVCPVSGDKVNPKVTYVFEGKRYAFCCPMCIKKFKKDPKKYLTRMAAGKFDAGMHHEMQESGDHADHEHHHH